MKEIIIPEVEFKVHDALVDGLKYMGNLNELPFENVPEGFHKPFKDLFQYSKKRMKQGGRDRHLPGLIKKIFPNEEGAEFWTRGTDAKHTIASFGYAVEICNGENFDNSSKKRLLSSIIIHDCAYPETGRVAQFNSDARTFHMNEAARIFPEFAKEINKTFYNFYSEKDVNEICAIVGQHDNPDVKKDGKFLDFKYNPPQKELLQAHREADRLWMPDKAGYALDLVRRLVISNPWYNNNLYLNHVLFIATNEAERYADYTKDCFKHKENFTIYRTQTGFNLFEREMKNRSEEYGVDFAKIEPVKYIN